MLAGRYSDGEVARMRAVDCALEGNELVVRAAADAAVLDRLPAADVFAVPARRGELRIGVAGRPAGLRLAFAGEAAGAARRLLPALARRRRAERRREAGALGLATLALVAAVGAYVLGVPLLARYLVGAVPAAWEQSLGQTALVQIEAMLKEEAGFEICDPDPQSLGNRAVARFAAAVLEGSGTPFLPDVKLVRTSVPNAFALPGGHAFYFSALLEQTNSPDEFAGVMAHELGHVVHRHGMEQLISSSATGLLVGFILGDMTGMSVAGGIGATLVDSRFSREAEREADRFAADAARRLGFQPAGLVDLLERVSGDDDMTRALALLSTHPLTSERRAALEAMDAPNADARPVFSDAEWAAIKSMCGAPPGPAVAPAGAGKLKNG